MPPLFTVTSWVARNHEGFGDRYWEARCSQAVLWSEQVLQILDDAKGEDSMARANMALGRRQTLDMRFPTRTALPGAPRSWPQ